MVIKGYNVFPLLKKTVKEISEDRIPSLAAETAYYFFFSIFPLLLFLTPLLGVLGNGEDLMNRLLTHLSASLPADALSLLQRTLTEIVHASGNPGVMSVGALLAGWSGSNIFGSLMDALNVAYDVSETRPWWKKTLLRLTCLAASAVVLLGATIVFLDGETVARWIGNAFQLGQPAIAALTVIEFVLAVVLVVLLGAFTYKILPNVKQRWAHVFVSAAIATVLWIVATIVFRIYVQHFGSYNKTYGAIGGVILLLMWMYYSMFVVLIGGELASELHHGSGALHPPAGAVYLGRIVTESGPGEPSMEKAKGH